MSYKCCVHGCTNENLGSVKIPYWNGSEASFRICKDHSEKILSFIEHMRVENIGPKQEIKKSVTKIHVCCNQVIRVKIKDGKIKFYHFLPFTAKWLSWDAKTPIKYRAICDKCKKEISIQVLYEGSILSIHTNYGK
jgi:hypothetical protein